MWIVAHARIEGLKSFTCLNCHSDQYQGEYYWSSLTSLRTMRNDRPQPLSVLLTQSILCGFDYVLIMFYCAVWTRNTRLRWLQGFDVIVMRAGAGVEHCAAAQHHGIRSLFR